MEAGLLFNSGGCRNVIFALLEKYPLLMGCKKAGHGRQYAYCYTAYNYLFQVYIKLAADALVATTYKFFEQCIGNQVA